MTVAATERASDVVTADLAVMGADLDEVFSAMSGERLLITGGAGFLGYYLVQGPLAWNAANSDRAPISVTVFDSYFRGVPDWLGQLEGRDGLELRNHDMRFPLPEDMGDFEWVIHAAGVASPTYYRAHPIETMDANINGLRNLLDKAVSQAAAGTPVRGFLFFSSSEIYGDPVAEAIPTPETYRGNVSCTGPRACYDESKRYGETLCVNFAQQHDIPVKIARPFNNYGPGMKITDGRVIADLARNMIAGHDLVLFSDGSPTRTFCYVADAVTGYFLALGKGGAGQPYNVGIDGPETSMAQLAETVARLGRELFGYQGQVVLGESPEKEYLIDNPNRRSPDITKARTQLGFDPKVDLEQGLRRTLLWYGANTGGEEA